MDTDRHGYRKTWVCRYSFVCAHSPGCPGEGAKPDLGHRQRRLVCALVEHIVVLAQAQQHFGADEEPRQAEEEKPAHLRVRVSVCDSVCARARAHARCCDS